MKKSLTLCAMLFLCACGPAPMGKFDTSNIDGNTRLVFGHITIEQSKYKQENRVCFTDANNQQQCGKLKAAGVYVRYDDEKPWADYVAITLPPGKTRISSISVGDTNYEMKDGFEFTVSADKDATYFGDVTIYVANGSSDGSDSKGRQSVVVNNSSATLEHLQSVNPSLEIIDSYATSLITPFKKYREVVTVHGESVPYFIFMPK